MASTAICTSKANGKCKFHNINTRLYNNLALLNWLSCNLQYTPMAYNMKIKYRCIERVSMVFVETTIFTNQLKGLLNDEEYRQLQNELVENPESGSLISGGGGIRKIRVNYGSKGKSGGARAIYYFKSADDQIYMLVIYPKSVKDNLSAAEKAILKDLAKSL